MTADDLRTSLAIHGDARRRARERVARVDADLAALLAQAVDHPELTMIEAAKLAGVGRSMAYKLVREHAEQ